MDSVIKGYNDFTNYKNDNLVKNEINDGLLEMAEDYQNLYELSFEFMK
jgi:hypothetical protein